MQELCSLDYADEMADYTGICDRKIRGTMRKRLTLARRKMYNIELKEGK
jgi:hypothetical protein